MLTTNDISDFVHVTRQDDAFIILQKSMIEEMDRHEWQVIKESWDISEEITSLRAARNFCYSILDALGVQVRYKHKGLSLEISVVDEREEEHKIEHDEVKN